MKHMLKKASWIWCGNGEPVVNQYVDFLSPFPASADDDAVLLLSAGSHYAVWLNGQRLPASQYADYPGEKVYDRVSLKGLLREGTNRLCITAYCQGESSFTYKKGPAGLIYMVAVESHALAWSNADTLCRPSRTWQSGPVEKVSPQLSYSFRYDANGEDGWRGEGYKAHETGGWRKAQVLTIRPKLRPRPVLPLDEQPPCPSHIAAQGVYIHTLPQNAPMGDRMQHAALAHRDFADMTGSRAALPWPLAGEEGIALIIPEYDQDAQGIYALADLGMMRAGLLTLDIDVPDSCEVLIGWGEHLDDLRVRTGVGGRQFACVYQAKPGRNRFTHPFKRVAGKYLMLMAGTPQITLRYLGIRETPYPLQRLPEPPLRNTLDKKIFDVSCRTLALCLHEHYEDCPAREQALYAMDSRLQMLCGYRVFEGADCQRASLELLAAGQLDSGLLEMCAPAECPITIPSFSLAFILAVHDLMVETGDKAFVCRMLPVMTRIIGWFLQQVTEDNLLKITYAPRLWHFHEWQDGLDGTYIPALAKQAGMQEGEAPEACEAPLQALLCLALEAMSHMDASCAGASGIPRKAGCRTAAAKLRKGLEAYYDADRGFYRTFLLPPQLDALDQPPHFAELTQALAILADAAADDRRAALQDALLAQDQGLHPTSLAYRYYKYEAALKGRPDLRQPVLDDIRRVWGNMLFAGATAFWETERGAWDFARAGSLCHGWAAIPIHFYAKHGLGMDASNTARPTAGERR